MSPTTPLQIHVVAKDEREEQEGLSSEACPVLPPASKKVGVCRFTNGSVGKSMENHHPSKSPN